MNVKLATQLNEPSEAQRALPFYNLLPKDRIGLLRWKLYARKRALCDHDFRAQLLQACAADVVFFAATFVWLHETRETERQVGHFPFVPDCDQADILAWFEKYVGRVDGVVEKTRGIGLSYLMCVHALWLWLFKPLKIDIGLVSKDVNSLDMKNRPHTLMGKLDTIFQSLPAYLRLDSSGQSVLERTSSQSHKFVHRQNGNAVLGFASTDEKLRSARLYCLFVDEAAFLGIEEQKWLAAAHGTSPSIWWISTHNGTAVMFYRLVLDDKSDLVRVSTYWWDNPRCFAGAYKSENGQIAIVDKGYEYPPDYEFSHEHPGKLRSPFTDRAFRRPGIDQQHILEELYGLAVIDSRKLIDARVIRAARSYCQVPLARGEVTEHGEFRDMPLDGELYFFVDPYAPFLGRYYLGVDSALGVAGAALAGVCVIDSETGLQVASAAYEACPPIELAARVVHLARYITAARGPGYCSVVYESTGVNVGFANELHRQKWPALYSEDGNRPGVHNRDRGLSWLWEFGRAIQANEVSIRDARVLDDLENFEIETGKYQLTFAGSVGHGDLGIAAALAWRGAKKCRQALFQKTDRQRIMEVGIEAEPDYRDRRRRRADRLYSGKFND